MKSLDILGANRFENFTKTREACRGIVVKENNILLTYEVNTDQWFIPGGGLEYSEKPEECCVRELAEETGYIVKPGKHFLTIHEYYEEWHFISHYYICDHIGETERNLTQRELEVGLEPRWIPLQEAINIFSKHNDYADENEMKRGAYLREYRALLEFTETNIMDCVFCHKEKITTDIVCEDELVMAFLDMDPINEGHVLLVPKKHYLDVNEMPDETLSHLMIISKKIVSALKEIYQPDGYSIMQNGGKFNDVGHYHLHIFPRYTDDGFGWTYGEGSKNVNTEIAKIIRDRISKIYKIF